MKEYMKRGIVPPVIFTPTICALTFALILQLAIILKYIIATADITLAYLHQLRGLTAMKLVTKMDTTMMSQICGLDPHQLYLIATYIYGLPESGRKFYQKYKEVLEKKGYRCSKR